MKVELYSVMEFLQSIEFDLTLNIDDKTEMNMIRLQMKHYTNIVMDNRNYNLNEPDSI